MKRLKMFIPLLIIMILLAGCTSTASNTTKNADDTTKGYVYIAGGAITITNSVEGIKGTAIVVEGGTIDITSQDDGFNAASASTEANDTAGGPGAMEVDANCYVSIANGTIKVNASGDGLDSNGNIYISGGNVNVSGPTANNNGALDYNGTADITGGTIVVAGSTGMAQGFSDTSTQCSLLYNLTTTCEGETEISLTDANGKVIVSYPPEKNFQSVVISTPELVQGQTYTLTCGSQTTAIELTSIVTSNGKTEMNGPGQGGGRNQ